MKSKVKVLSVIGTRPETIKMAPLLLKMSEQSLRFNSIVCVTGQHRHMLDQALDTFSIRVDYDLNAMGDNQKLSELTSRIIIGVENVINQEKPDIIFVQGDTTTTLAASLAAFYNGVPIAHIESGLRTSDLHNPFPEEANRVLVDRLSSFCFAPTELNRKNLIREGIPSESIFVTGNTAIDALFLVRNTLKDINPEVWNNQWGNAKVAIDEREKPLILITAHRRESFGEGLESIYKAIRDLAETHSDWNFIYPVHLNPNVLGASKRILSGIKNIYLLKPLDYKPFVYLMDRAYIILTDSGGIQEEAPSLGKPVLVLREKTERQEALDTGTVVLAGINKENIIKKVNSLMNNPIVYEKISNLPNPYGDGFASERILDHIWQSLA